MTTIKQDDLITSVTDSLQYISYYHSPDFVKAMHLAWQKEESESARNAIAQILVNSRMSAEGRRPICQDTGIVVVFVKVGMNVRWEANLSLQEMIDEGVRRAYLDTDNPLRASIVSPPHRQTDKHQGQYPVRDPHGDGSGGHGRGHGIRQGRRFGKQEQVHHAQPQ